MIETKKMYEEDNFNICGYYSDGHVNKEEFVEIVIEHIKEDIEEGSIYLMDEEEEKFLLTTVDIDKVEYVWYREEEIDDDSRTTLFWFSNKAKEGYSRMTRVYL
jgi:hypothetical protein